MFLKLLPPILFLAFSAAEQPSVREAKADVKPQEGLNTKVYLLTPVDLPKNEPLQELRQFPGEQQYSPEIYGLTYLQPQGAQSSLHRLQPQIVLYGPGGQGQPILINPGNPPGNFLIPQGPGPNVVLRNNPQGLFPVAGYPKPAHVPAIEKDAEEVPTNPAKVPPLKTGILLGQPKDPKLKPEKLETFTETTAPDTKTAQGQLPNFAPENVSLRPGQRFFFLNGNNLFNYPYEEKQELPLGGVRYTNVQQHQLIPQKFLQPFAREPPQYVQDLGHSPASGSVPDLLLRNSFLNNNPEFPTQANEAKPDGVIRAASQYSRTGAPPDHLNFPPAPQFYYVEPQKPINAFPLGLDQQITSGLGVRSSSDGISTNALGQFRFSPVINQDLYQFKDDVENDAVVVDASFDASTNNDQRQGSLKAAESVTSATTESEKPKKETEPTMAQAGPRATAIAGAGGVAGSAPRGTAIVGKGGLAVSSPQATAVAGTKEDEEIKEKSEKKQS
ncbi:uncharacterized protein [Euwallacea similis]|uniref:uncharacterized protein n=1 Tax=Euwallacea similis TaxID=1736056 RepID=UPI00344C845C